MTAKPIASLFNDNPGPEVEVQAIAPANEAPIAEHIPAISSSAWNTLAPKDLCFANSTRISVAGVIG